jgi:DNA-directed RNA polymerase specialized sigma24 family protein
MPTTVPVHDAGGSAQSRTRNPAGGLAARSDQGAAPSEMPEPCDSYRLGRDVRALARLEHHDRLQARRAIKPRRRDALYLRGLGYSYAETMRLTSSTYTAVNRRITEGRAALRHHVGDDDGPRRS